MLLNKNAYRMMTNDENFLVQDVEAMYMLTFDFGMRLELDSEIFVSKN